MFNVNEISAWRRKTNDEQDEQDERVVVQQEGEHGCIIIIL